MCVRLPKLRPTEQKSGRGASREPGSRASSSTELQPEFCQEAWNRSGSSPALRLHSALPGSLICSHTFTFPSDKADRVRPNWVGRTGSESRTKTRTSEPKFVWSCRRSVRLVHRLSPDCCCRCDLGGGALNQPHTPFLAPFCKGLPHVAKSIWTVELYLQMLNPEVQSWCWCSGPTQHVMVHLCAEASAHCGSHGVSAFFHVALTIKTSITSPHCHQSNGEVCVWAESFYGRGLTDRSW